MLHRSFLIVSLPAAAIGAVCALGKPRRRIGELVADQ